MKIYVYVGEETRKKAEEYFRGFLELRLFWQLGISLDDCRIACNLFAREDVLKEPPRDSAEEEIIVRFREQLNSVGLLDREADIRKQGGTTLINRETKGSTVPKAFEELLGREYWSKVSKDQLWAWIEAIATRQCNCYSSLAKVIEICGSEDLLLEDDPCLGQKHKSGATLLEDLRHQYRTMCEQGKFTPHDDIGLIVWCVKRLTEIEREES